MAENSKLLPYLMFSTRFMVGYSLMKCMFRHEEKKIEVNSKINGHFNDEKKEKYIINFKRWYL